MAPALAQLTCRVIQSPSEEAPGLLASGAHSLEAHHSPALFHVQHALVQAVSGPMATKERAAHKAVTEAQEQRERLHIPPPSHGDEPEKRGPGRPPKVPLSLEQAERALEAANREYERLAEQRARGKAHLRGMGHAYHCVALERGGRRHGQRIASDMQERIAQRRTVAQQEGLSQRSLARIAKAERGVPKMQATIAFGSGYVRPQGDQRDLTQPASFALHAKLLPSYSLDRVAHTRTVEGGAALRELAEQRRAPLFAPGGILRALSPETHNHLHDAAKRLAAVFQRSSSNGEGRHGSLSLRSHPLRGLDLPRKRECLTAMHNFFLTRPDGTTAAERFFGQKPCGMFTAILASVELPPAPLSPPRRAVG
jgi:uncharacterized protein DUF6399